MSEDSKGSGETFLGRGLSLSQGAAARDEQCGMEKVEETETGYPPPLRSPVRGSDNQEFKQLR